MKKAAALETTNDPTNFTYSVFIIELAENGPKRLALMNWTKVNTIYIKSQNG